MGFTDRMGDVLAASDALVHSSAGLTVLEAIIRGCPVISYGFGYGHVRASNAALERFGLAQVARKRSRDRSGARAGARQAPRARRLVCPASVDRLADPHRRASRAPGARWRLRTARAITAAAAAVVIGGWVLTTGTSYTLVSHFVHMRADDDRGNRHGRRSACSSTLPTQRDPIARERAVGLRAARLVHRRPAERCRDRGAPLWRPGAAATARARTGALARYQRSASRRAQPADSDTTSCTRRAAPASASGGSRTAPAGA